MKQQQAAVDAADSLEKLHSARILRDLAANSVEIWTKSVACISSMPDYACRLRFRAKNEFGAKVLRDIVFSVDRGKVLPIEDDRAKALKSGAFRE